MENELENALYSYFSDLKSTTIISFLKNNCSFELRYIDTLFEVGTGDSMTDQFDVIFYLRPEIYENIESSKDIIDEIQRVINECSSSLNFIIRNIIITPKIMNNSEILDKKTLIEKIKQLMIDVSTGKKDINDYNDEYRKIYEELNNVFIQEKINNPNEFSDLWEFHHYWSEKLKTYASRRSYIINLYKVNNIKSMSVNNYISKENIIDELEKIKEKRNDVDLRTLIELCNSINFNYSNGKNLATIILLRVLVDHIPPIFNQPTFEAVASSYGWIGSNKKIILNISDNLKNICHKYIHHEITHKEMLPSDEELDFKANFETLLQEIIRLLNKDDYKIIEIKKDIKQKQEKDNTKKDSNKKNIEEYLGENQGMESVNGMDWQIYTNSDKISAKGPFCPNDNYQLDFHESVVPDKNSYYSCELCHSKIDIDFIDDEESIKNKAIKILEARQRKGELNYMNPYR